MSEEINRREFALSDAELENVSGAGREEDRRAEERADEICAKCGLGKSHCSGTPYRSLKAYLKEHGPYSVDGFHNCPYYTR